MDNDQALALTRAARKCLAEKALAISTHEQPTG